MTPRLKKIWLKCIAGCVVLVVLTGYTRIHLSPASVVHACVEGHRDINERKHEFILKDSETTTLAEGTVNQPTKVLPENTSYDAFNGSVQVAVHTGIKHAVLYRNKRDKMGFLTIGIPSVKRPFNKGYLYSSLSSVVNNTSVEEKLQVTVVIFLADSDSKWNRETADRICSDHAQHCKSGFFHVIQAPKYIYPDWSSLPTVKGETPARVQWRSKQNIDFSFLMLYSEPISEYYIQMEDDLEYASDFVQDIRDTIRSQAKWICLEFSGLGFIGKLFRSSHLHYLAHCLLTFYDSQPCDLLLGYVFRILGQMSPIHSSKSLFQHLGRISSLQNKMMPSVDRNYKDFGKKPLQIFDVVKGDNPTADIKTSLQNVEVSVPENAYSNSSLFYMAQNVKNGDFYRLLYNNSINLTRISVSTGEKNTQYNHIKEGKVEVSAYFSCQQADNIGNFVDGEFDTQALGVSIPPNIKCITIHVTQSQKHLIIRQISVNL